MRDKLKDQSAIPAFYFENYRVIMQLVLFIICTILSFKLHANPCGVVAKYDQLKSKIFVVCPMLPEMTIKELENVVNSIFNENKFKPDEYTIDFVISKESLNQDVLTENNYVGFYYTHNNSLIVWPKNKNKKRYVQLFR